MPAALSLPHVTINMAMSADGKIASVNGAVSSPGSPADFEHLIELRATADAVMAGARTVESADMNLGPGPKRYRDLRRRRGLAEYNLRVVVSGRATLDPRCALFQKRFSPIIVLTTAAAPRARRERLAKVADVVQVCGDDELDFRAALAWLRREWKVRRLLCEGGGELNHGLLRAGLVDELHLTICPKIIGGLGAPAIFDGSAPVLLPDATQFKLKSMKRRGDELFTVYGLVDG